MVQSVCGQYPLSGVHPVCGMSPLSGVHPVCGMSPPLAWISHIPAITAISHIPAITGHFTRLCGPIVQPVDQLYVNIP